MSCLETNYCYYISTDSTQITSVVLMILLGLPLHVWFYSDYLDLILDDVNPLGHFVFLDNLSGLVGEIAGFHGINCTVTDT